MCKKFFCSLVILDKTRYKESNDVSFMTPRLQTVIEIFKKINYLPLKTSVNTLHSNLIHLCCWFCFKSNENRNFLGFMVNYVFIAYRAKLIHVFKSTAFCTFHPRRV